MARDRHRRRVPMAALGVTVVFALAGCGGSLPAVESSPASVAPTIDAAVTADPALRTGLWSPVGSPLVLASGLDAPWSVVPLPSRGALLSQRGDGAVVELAPDGTLRAAGHVPGVVAQSEGGLLGLALWHDEDDASWLYAYLTAADDNRVVRMPLTGAQGAYTLGEPAIVLDGIAKSATHNGGRLAFGPDGMLYVTTGDAGDPGRSQDTASLNGKILRLTPEGDAAPGNPFGNAVWSFGHRNVQGVAWTSDGTMWASEFGQNTWDELNVIRPGANYGWPIVEGIGGDERFTDPTAQWGTADASPSGLAAAGDTLFLAALRGTRLWIADTDGESLLGDPRAELIGEHGRLRDAVTAPDGSLWVLTNNTDGRGDPRTDDDLLLRVPLERNSTQ
ncbi:MAG: PQQ-dependent sugar dehydrogenase [Microbacterium sp.]|uniref:PQQ-dependent sugar dehydrogenase n=1 Tax=Microbacterium sp. TaxID=51671 RepID=UPI003A83A1B5